MKWKIDHIDTTYIDLGLYVGTNIVNIKSVLVWWCSMHEKVKQHWGWVEENRYL